MTEGKRTDARKYASQDEPWEFQEDIPPTKDCIRRCVCSFCSIPNRLLIIVMIIVFLAFQTMYLEYELITTVFLRKIFKEYIAFLIKILSLSIMPWSVSLRILPIQVFIFIMDMYNCSGTIWYSIWRRVFCIHYSFPIKLSLSTAIYQAPNNRRWTNTI